MEAGSLHVQLKSLKVPGTLTRSELHQMKLSSMTASYRQQMDDGGITTLSFDERFGLLVDTEWTPRKNNRLKRLIRRVDFPISGDEWLLTPLTDPESRSLLEIVEARHGRCSTIFSSQFNPAGWQARIGEGPLAEAILDRIVHDSYTILIEGEESRIFCL
jgi:hypothetical protein